MMTTSEPLLTMVRAILGFMGVQLASSFVSDFQAGNKRWVSTLYSIPDFDVLSSKIPELSFAEAACTDTVLCPDYELPKDRPVLIRERNGWCPYSERVWLALEAKNVDFDTCLIDNMGQGRPAWYSGQTPQVSWPCKGEEGTITERQHDSMAILKSLDSRCPSKEVCLYESAEDSSTSRRKEIQRLMDQFSQCFPKNTRPSSRAAFLFSSGGETLSRKEFEDTLDKTEAVLSMHDGPFFYGREFTAADCVFAPFLERYAAQLPLLYRGLNVRDKNRWPLISQWFEAMETLVPAYSGRVQGDVESWQKVLLQQGYGDATFVLSSTSIVEGSAQTDKRELRRESMQLSMQLIAHQYYSKQRPSVSSSPEVQACNCLIRSKVALVADMARRGHAGGSEGAEHDLKCLVWALLGEGKEKMELDADARKGAYIAASYVVDRVCVPRDMGRLAMLTVRTLHKRLSVSVSVSAD